MAKSLMFSHFTSIYDIVQNVEIHFLYSILSPCGENVTLFTGKYKAFFSTPEFLVNIRKKIFLTASLNYGMISYAALKILSQLL